MDFIIWRRDGSEIYCHIFFFFFEQNISMEGKIKAGEMVWAWFVGKVPWPCQLVEEGEVYCKADNAV